MTSLLKDLNIDVYSKVDDEAKKILRYKTYRLVFSHWRLATNEEIFDGSLKDMYRLIIDELERREEYEACQCILETMYEYSARLD